MFSMFVRNRPRECLEKARFVLDSEMQCIVMFACHHFGIAMHENVFGVVNSEMNARNCIVLLSVRNGNVFCPQGRNAANCHNVMFVFSQK